MMPTGIEQHARADVERARQQEVDVGLLQLQLARLLEAFDEGVLELELADEADAVGELVRDQQHEAMEVELAVLELRLVVLEVHVAREPGGARTLGLPPSRRQQQAGDRQRGQQPRSAGAGAWRT